MSAAYSAFAQTMSNPDSACNLILLLGIGSQIPKDLRAIQAPGYCVRGDLVPAMGTKGAPRLGNSQSGRYSVDADVGERMDARTDRQFRLVSSSVPSQL
jgi:hypothetical protein